MHLANHSALHGLPARQHAPDIHHTAAAQHTPVNHLATHGLEKAHISLLSSNLLLLQEVCMLCHRQCGLPQPQLVRGAAAGSGTAGGAAER
jgi:hypothetical protein